MRVKQLVGIALAVVTILNAVPVTSLIQPEVIRAEVLTTCGTLKVSTSKTTLNKVPNKSLKVPLRASMIGLNTGDKLKMVTWEVVNLDTNKVVHSYCKNLNANLRKNAYRVTDSNCSINSVGRYKVKCKAYLEAHAVGDYEIVSDEFRFNVVTNISYLTKEVAKVWKETHKLFYLNVDNIYSDKGSYVKASDILGNIKGELANNNLIESQVKELDPNATMSVSCTPGKASFYIKDKKAKKVYKSEWKNDIQSVPLDDEKFTIMVNKNVLKEYFKANRGKGAYIKIPVKVKVTVKSGTKTKTLNNSAYIIIED